MPFATVQFKRFAQSAITTSLTTVYTVPASSQDVVKDINLANTTGSTVTVTVHIVPSGGTASAATQLIPSAGVAANTPYRWTGTQVMNTGDFIQVIASATGATITTSGMEST